MDKKGRRERERKIENKNRKRRKRCRPVGSGEMSEDMQSSELDSFLRRVTQTLNVQDHSPRCYILAVAVSITSLLLQIINRCSPIALAPTTSSPRLEEIFSPLPFHFPRRPLHRFFRFKNFAKVRRGHRPLGKLANRPMYNFDSL